VPSPFASYAIFCDDVRAEATGKALLIGVYQDEMYVNGDAPWLLSQFYVRVVFRMPEVKPLPTLAFKLASSNEDGTTVLWELNHPGFENGPTLSSFYFEPERPRTLTSVFNIALTPFVIEKPTRLEVIAVVNGEEQLIDRLRVTRNPNAAPAS
jgi:hypothetical protein